MRVLSGVTVAVVVIRVELTVEFQKNEDIIMVVTEVAGDNNSTTKHHR